MRMALWAVAALVACLPGCVRPQRAEQVVELPREQIEVMAERERRAQELFGQALDAADAAHQKETYREAIRLNPLLAKAYNNLAVIYLKEGGHGEAIRLLREAAARAPGSPVPRFNLGYAYELIGRLRDAEAEYAAAVAAGPQDPDYLESLARVHIRRRDRLGEAKELLRRALREETRPERVKWINTQLESLEKGFLP